MTDEQRLDQLEAMLRTVPPMHDVPTHLVQACASAAFEDEPQRRSPGRPRVWRPRLWSSVAAAAVAVTLGAAVLHGFGGQAGGSAFQRTVALRSSGPASGVVEIGQPASAVEPIRVSISGLPPASDGHYYEMWVRTSGGSTRPTFAFNTTQSGSADLRFSSSANTRWVTCWITLEAPGQPGHSRIVLHATPVVRAA
jgi:hypothetical protein